MVMRVRLKRETTRGEDRGVVACEAGSSLRRESPSALLFGAALAHFLVDLDCPIPLEGLALLT